MDTVALRDRVIAVARAAGLAGVGVCRAERFDDARVSLEDAVASGRSAGMRFTFADPASSSDVRSTLPWARRLVVGANAYLPAAGRPGDGAAGSARIARFATDDHYAPLRSALGSIAGLLLDEGHRAEVLVDDNRLVDRAAAVRAGVGWWGKNTMVLVPGSGPWVLLGSVATDAPLPTDAPMRRSCGTCEACLPACPTGALTAPGVLDARRCLAHWLQAPGAIPRPLRRAVGDRLYGCDDCLEACPPGTRLRIRAREPSGRVDARSVLALADHDLLSRFRRFYVPRRRARYLRRNALVVLGNTGGESEVPILAGYAGHSDPLLREHAVWALGRIGGPLGRAVLVRVAASDPNPTVAAEARRGVR
jgi:epoxyqueuosine reductase